MVESTNTYYKDAKTWQQILQQYKDTKESVYFTYAITNQLNVKVFSHFENSDYSQVTPATVGTTQLLPPICNLPPITEAPEISK